MGQCTTINYPSFFQYQLLKDYFLNEFLVELCKIFFEYWNHLFVYRILKFSSCDVKRFWMNSKVYFSWIYVIFDEYIQQIHLIVLLVNFELYFYLLSYVMKKVSFVVCFWLLLLYLGGQLKAKFLSFIYILHMTIFLPILALMVVFFAFH